jgi:Uroporphyrinogen decarboxylase (URO-D)
MSMTSKERLKTTLAHKAPDRIAIDFGATPVTGIHVLILQKLREHYGLKKIPVKVTEPYQMLGEIDPELMDILGVDVIGLNPRTNILGFESNNWKEFRMWWGQEVLVPGNFNTKTLAGGDLLLFPEGDMTVQPSVRMPSTGYFFDTLIRQEPLDEGKLNVDDNLEEFAPLLPVDIDYWTRQIEIAKKSDRGIVANFGGTALGDIALVPAPFMKHPRGIRDIQEWYMSTLVRPDFIKEVFERQTDIAVENLKKLFSIAGNVVDVVYLCGNDFGTQQSTFCDLEGFREFYVPYYRKMTQWIHANTEWKIFKHSCGAVEPLLQGFIEAGFDILNPVQISAAGMNPEKLKEKYGKQLVFWGGGVDTQKMLAFGTPDDVKKQVRELCSVFSREGGFVFNTVHNIQANVPVENVAAMIDTLMFENH